jgi:hypothetical protein
MRATAIAAGGTLVNSFEHSHIPQKSLRNLLEGYCDDTLSPEETARLDTLLADDADARRQFCEFVGLHAQLWCRLRLPDLAVAVPVAASELEIDSELAVVIDSNRPARSLAASFRLPAKLRRAAMWASLAAGMMFALYFVAISWDLLWPSRNSQLVVAEPGSEKSNGLTPGQRGLKARAVASQRVLPAQDHVENSTRMPIHSGEIQRAETGLVELAFDQGATAIIEAPAQWTVINGNRMILSRGRLVATVPPRASGFAVETPYATIIDIGTQFGVQVDDDAQADVSVLQGLVQVQPKGQSREDATRLTAGQSAVLSSGQVKVNQSSPEQEKFTNILKQSAPPTKGRGYRVLFHYRFGGEAGAQAGQIAAEKVLSSEAADEFNVLTRVGEPTYAAAAPRGVGLSLNLSKQDQAQGYLGDKFTTLPHEYCALEAWVRLRSTNHGQLIAYVGHPAYNGYGLLQGQAKWKTMHGSQQVFDSQVTAATNAWTHLALVRELAYVQLYVNGKPVGPRQQVACKAPEPKLYIGYAPGNLPQTLDGEIAEVRLINMNRAFEPTMLLCAENNETK